MKIISANPSTERQSMSEKEIYIKGRRTEEGETQNKIPLQISLWQWKQIFLFYPLQLTGWIL